MWCKEKGFPLLLSMDLVPPHFRSMCVCVCVCVFLISRFVFFRSGFVFFLFLFKTHLDLNSCDFWF